MEKFKHFLSVGLLLTGLVGTHGTFADDLAAVAYANQDLTSSDESSSGIPNLNIKTPDDWVDHKPYVPEEYDYFLELGAMWEERNMYWMGAGFGRHIGTCVFTESQTCQQYWDLFGGVGGRDGLTSLLFLTGPRWQFVHFPEHSSPSVRLFVGAMNLRDDLRDKEIFTGGAGYGWTVSVHERVDLRLEGRVGYADDIWYQSVVAVHVKMDRWVDYFGSQLKKLGVEAFEATGSAIKKTGNAIGDALTPSKFKKSNKQKKE